MALHYDLIVIGSGPAGRRAAAHAVTLQKRVLVIERGRSVGGEAREGGAPQRAQAEMLEDEV